MRKNAADAAISLACGQLSNLQLLNYRHTELLSMFLFYFVW